MARSICVARTHYSAFAKRGHLKTRIAFLATLFLQTVLQAQTVGGTITGVVTDPAYQPLANATVQLTHVETNRRRDVVSDAGGGFTIANLPPGDYRIEAARDGYRKHAQPLTLQLNQEMQIEMPLVPGQRTDTVEVIARRVDGAWRIASIGAVVEH